MTIILSKSIIYKVKGGVFFTEEAERNLHLYISTMFKRVTELMRWRDGLGSIFYQNKQIFVVW